MKQWQNTVQKSHDEMQFLHCAIIGWLPCQWNNYLLSRSQRFANQPGWVEQANWDCAPFNKFCIIFIVVLYSSCIFIIFLLFYLSSSRFWCPQWSACTSWSWQTFLSQCVQATAAMTAASACLTLSPQRRSSPSSCSSVWLLPGQQRR